jgi:hypothetical protein
MPKEHKAGIVLKIKWVALGLQLSLLTNLCGFAPLRERRRRKKGTTTGTK